MWGSVLKDESVLTRRNQGAEWQVGGGSLPDAENSMSWEGETPGGWSAGSPGRAPQRRLGGRQGQTTLDFIGEDKNLLLPPRIPPTSHGGSKRIRLA